MTAPAPPPPEKVLIIKPSSLGDVISALPVLRGLGRSFPQARVAWLVTPGCADVLVGQPGLDEIIRFDRKRYGRIARSARATGEFVAFCRRLRRRRFDWVIDLQGLFRSGFLARVSGAPVRAGFADAREAAWLFYRPRVRVAAAHTVARNIELARALGVDARGEDLALSVGAEARASADALLVGTAARPGEYVVAAPGTRWANKLYPVRHWRRVVAELSAAVPVVVVGAGGERALCAEVAGGQGNAFDLSGRTSLRELVAVIASARAVICCDSAANFIASAVGTPFVTLMGPTRRRRTGPYGAGGVALVADVPCRGCLKRSCRHVTCMQSIAPAEVLAAVRRLLRRAARPAGQPAKS